MADISFENLNPNFLELLRPSELDKDGQTAIKFISEGKEIPSKITKMVLVKVINFFLDLYDCKKEETSESPRAKPEENIPEQKEEMTESQAQIKPTSPAAQICKFYKSGRCQHGIAGKKVMNGKTCDRLHPKMCLNSKNFGYCKAGKECKYLHLTICKEFMKRGECAYGEKCNRYHPKKARQNREKVAGKQASARHVTKSPEIPEKTMQDDTNSSRMRRDSGPETAGLTIVNPVAENSFLEKHTAVMFNMLEKMTEMMAKFQSMSNNNGPSNITNNRMWGQY